MNKLLLFCLALLFSSQVSAKHKRISLCYESWRPFAYIENQQSKGIVINKLNRAAAKSQAQLIFHELPFKRCVKKVKQGIIDFTLFVDQQDELALLNQVISHWQIAAVSKPSLILPSKQALLELSDARFIISQDYQYPENFNSFIKQLSGEIMGVSYYVKDKQEAVALFSIITNNRADIMFVDKTWASFLKTKYDLAINISSFSLYSMPQYIGYGNISKDKINLMNKVLANITPLPTVTKTQ